jgi:general stress protein 26
VDDLRERIARVAKELQLSCLATVTEEGKPWVRYVMTAADDDLTLRCATFADARKVKQIENDPEVHLTCGVSDPTHMQPYLQIQAKARLSTDEQERHAFWNPSLEQIFDGPDDPKYAVLIITPYRIEYCSPASLEAEVWEA